MFRYLAVVTIAAVVLLMLLPTVLSNGQYLQSWWRELRQPKLDKCSRCKGARGGVPGNESVINNVVLCDYCAADDLKQGLDSLRQHNTRRPTGDNKDVK